MSRPEAVSDVDRFASSVKRLRHAAPNPFLREVASLATSGYVSSGLGLVTAFVAARLIGARGFGMAVLVTAYPLFLWGLAAVKSVAVSTRYIVAFRDGSEPAKVLAVCKLTYLLDLAIAGGVALLVALSGPFVSTRFFHLPRELAPLMVLYAASFVASSFAETSRAIMFAWHRLELISRLTLLEALLTLVCTVLPLADGAGPSGLIVGWSVAKALSGLITLSSASRILRRDGLPSWVRADVRVIRPVLGEIRSLLGWSYLSSTVNGAVAQVPTMVLGHVARFADAGFYRLATSIAGIGTNLEVSLARAAFPRLCRRWSTNRTEDLGQTLTSWSLRTGMAVVAGAAIGCAALPFVVPRAFGPDYGPMVPGTVAMVVAATVSTVFFWTTPLYDAFGRIAFRTKVGAAQALLLVATAWPAAVAGGFGPVALLSAVAKVGAVAALVGCALRSGAVTHAGPASPVEAGNA